MATGSFLFPKSIAITPWENFDSRKSDTLWDMDNWDQMKPNEVKSPIQNCLDWLLFWRVGIIQIVIGNLRYPLTARKRHICASWDLPRKSKNLRPCAVHFGVLHKVFFSSYFVLANHAATPAFLPFGTRADPEKISIFLWANSATPPLYYRSIPS